MKLPPREPKRLDGADVSVRLDAAAEPKVTVHVTKSAYAVISDECARCGDYETGGWLTGPRAFSWHGDQRIIEATVAVKQRSASSVNLDADEFLRMDEHLVAQKRSGKGFDLRAVGDWHSHPGCDGTPSENDLGCWARDWRRSPPPTRASSA